MNCDPDDLMERAKCFRCLSPETLNWVAIYILCYVAQLKDANPGTWPEKEADHVQPPPPD